MSYIKRYLEDRVDELACKYNWAYEEVMDIFFEFWDLDKVERILRDANEMTMRHDGPVIFVAES